MVPERRLLWAFLHQIWTWLNGAAGCRGLCLRAAVYLIDRLPVCFFILVISVVKIIQAMLKVLQFMICNR